MKKLINLKIFILSLSTIGLILVLIFGINQKDVFAQNNSPAPCTESDLGKNLPQCEARFALKSTGVSSNDAGTSIGIGYGTSCNTNYPDCKKRADGKPVTSSSVQPFIKLVKENFFNVNSSGRYSASTFVNRLIAAYSSENGIDPDKCNNLSYLSSTNGSCSGSGTLGRTPAGVNIPSGQSFTQFPGGYTYCKSPDCISNINTPNAVIREAGSILNNVCIDTSKVSKDVITIYDNSQPNYEDSLLWVNNTSTTGFSNFATLCPNGWHASAAAPVTTLFGIGNFSPMICCPDGFQFVYMDKAPNIFEAQYTAACARIPTASNGTTPVSKDDKSLYPNNISVQGLFTGSPNSVYSSNGSEIYKLDTSNGYDPNERSGVSSSTNVIYYKESGKFTDAKTDSRLVSRMKGLNIGRGAALGQENSSQDIHDYIFLAENPGAQNVCANDNGCAIITDNTLQKDGKISGETRLVASKDLRTNDGKDYACTGTVSCFAKDEPIGIVTVPYTVKHTDNSVTTEYKRYVQFCNPGAKAGDNKTVTNLYAKELINNNLADTLAYYRSDPENQAALASCRASGGIYIGIGCIDTTPVGLITGAIRIVLGVIGGVALIQLIIAGIMYQTGDEAKIKEAREKVVSTITGVVVLIFSILILRILGYNVLDILPKGFV